MTSYQITPTDGGVAIELTNVGDKQQRLLAAFAECEAGQCSCPTNEYAKVADVDIVATQDAINIQLQAKPGNEFNTREIGACLNYTVDKATR